MRSLPPPAPVLYGGEAWCEALTRGRNGPEETFMKKVTSSEQAKELDNVEPQAITDWLVKSSALNPGKWAASLTAETSSQGRLG